MLCLHENQRLSMQAVTHTATTRGGIIHRGTAEKAQRKGTYPPRLVASFVEANSSTDAISRLREAGRKAQVVRRQIKN
jgi:hypothetical protein